MTLDEITRAVIGAAIEVHRHLGPGLLESAYEECLCRELSLRQIPLINFNVPVLKQGIRRRVLNFDEPLRSSASSAPRR